MINLQRLNEPKSEIHGIKYLPQNERIFKVEIGDLPVLRSDDNKLICLPKERKENIKIGLFGATGSGKDLVGNSILGRAFFSWNISCAVLNDCLNETSSWALRDTDFERELRLLNEVPYPLPMVSVYPQNKDTEINCGITVPHIRESVPFSKMVECLERYIELKPNTLKYLLTIRDKLKECQNFEEIEEKINELGKKKKGVNIESSKYAMLSALDDLKKEGYVDIVARQEKFELSGTPSSKITIKKEDGSIEEGPVFSTLMNNGYVPSLQTGNLLHLRYAEPYLADKLTEMFEYPKIYGKDCLAYIQEAKLFMKYPDVVKGMENIAGRGRMRGVKLIYNTQHYTSIKQEIITNTIYCFAFNQKEETANKMKKDFDLSEGEKTQIINLKKHQCLAIASAGEKWAVYDLNTGERDFSGKQGCYRGYPIYPLSLHKAGGKNEIRNAA